MSGFAAMGMEILWFRHFTILLGGFRAVFSLLLTVILIGIGCGSLASSFLQPPLEPAGDMVDGRAGALRGVRPASDWRSPTRGHIGAVVTANPAYRGRAGRFAARLPEPSGLARALGELWFNGRPMLVELAVPALLMGLTFPLANAVIQQAEPSVGRRAGVLYLSNTAGAVFGSLAAGFLFLPSLGIQAQRDRVDDRRRARHRAARAGDRGAAGGRSGRSSSRARRSWRGRCCHPATSSTGRWRGRTTPNGASRCAKG